MSLSPVQIKDKLLAGIDEDKNVVNPTVVEEVIGLLEKTALTLTDLQHTRLGRYINDIRKKTSDKSLSTRCRKLVKSWQQLAPSSNNGSPSSTTGYSPALTRVAGTLPYAVSPGLSSQPGSPALVSTNVPRISPANRALSPLVRGAVQNNGSTLRAKAAPASPISSAYIKRISPAVVTKQSAPNARGTSYSSVSTAQTSPAVNAHRNHSSQALFHSTNHVTPGAANSQTNQTPNIDVTNRVYAGNKKRRRSEESEASDASSIKRSRQLINGEVKTSERVRTPKVKTTVELIAELQVKNKSSITASDTINKIVTNQIKKEEDDINISVVPAAAKPRPRRKNGSLVNPPEAPSDLSKTKSDMLRRFLQLQQDSTPSPSSLVEEETAEVDIMSVEAPQPKQTAERIEDPYALLPPLDVSSIVWSDDEDTATDSVMRRNPITGEYPEGCSPGSSLGDADEQKLTKVLSENWHGVNGTSVANKSTEFHEWTDTFTINRTNCDKDDVYILPYVDL